MKLTRKTYIVKQTLNQTQLKRAEEISGIPSPIKAIEIDEVGRWHIFFKRKMITGMQNNILYWNNNSVLDQHRKEYVLTGVKHHIEWSDNSYVEKEDPDWYKSYINSLGFMKNEGETVVADADAVAPVVAENATPVVATETVSVK